MEGDNSQVEMKSPSDIEEEAGENGVGDHLNHNSNNTPYLSQKLGCSTKSICYIAIAVLVMFIVGKSWALIEPGISFLIYNSCLWYLTSAHNCVTVLMSS